MRDIKAHSCRLELQCHRLIDVKLLTVMLLWRWICYVFLFIFVSSTWLFVCLFISCDLDHHVPMTQDVAEVKCAMLLRRHALCHKIKDAEAALLRRQVHQAGLLQHVRVHTRWNIRYVFDFSDRCVNDALTVLIVTVQDIHSAASL